jgi:hypothetical protein
MTDEKRQKYEALTDHDLLVTVVVKIDAIEEKLDDHECRIRNVERGVTKVLGIGAFVGFIAGLLGRFWPGGGS